MKLPLSTLPRCIARVLLALAAVQAVAQTTDAQSPSAATAVWLDPDYTFETIGPLREAAAVGNAGAALVVATRLVNRYERRGVAEDLFEAVIWIDRYKSDEAFAKSGLIQRVQQRDCRQQVLRYHPLCNPAR